MESALKGVTSSCWWQNDLMTVVGTNPGRRKPMCSFMAESTLNSGKVSVGQAGVHQQKKNKGVRLCLTVKVSQTVPRSQKNLKSGNAGIFYPRWWTKKTRTESFLGRNRVIRKLSSAGSCCSRSRWFRSSAIFVHRFTSPKSRLGWNRPSCYTVDGRNPKQPPGMVKTL